MAASVRARLSGAISAVSPMATTSPPTASNSANRARHSSHIETWAATTMLNASGNAPAE
jgi:hypothetical protein